jgi:hypothetical protein
MNQCEQLKQEYNNLKSLKQEFDLEYEKAVETRNTARAKELKIEIERKMAELSEKLHPFERVLNLREQYESQREILQRTGILEKLSSGEMGIKGIDGKEYAFPTYQEMTKRMRENKEMLKTKIEQGFIKLLIVPFGMKLDDLIEKYKEVLWRHYKERKLFATMNNPNDQPKFPDDLPLFREVIDAIKARTMQYEDLWKTDGRYEENGKNKM